VKKKRHLLDLYTTGRMVEIADGRGQPVEVWLQKISPMDHEVCLRRANAARARMLMHRNDPNSEEWQATYAEVDDIGLRNGLVDFLVGTKVATKRQAVEAETEAKDEWAKDGYLAGLLDAWEGTTDEDKSMKEVHAEDPTDPDAQKIFEEMQRFVGQVDKAMEPVEKGVRKELERESDDDLRKMIIDVYIQGRADSVWVRELNISELFYAARDPEDRNTRYFTSRDELDSLAPEVIGGLLEPYRALIVDVTEGKESAETDVSSVSSEPPTQQDSEVSSPPLAVVT
jgi:hypothetical protein